MLSLSVPDQAVMLTVSCFWEQHGATVMVTMEMYSKGPIRYCRGWGLQHVPYM